jgi:hypothetical protein
MLFYLFLLLDYRLVTYSRLSHNAHLFSFSAVYEDWSLDQSLEFLKAQGVAIRDSKNLAAIQSQVAENADAAATVSGKFLLA